MLSISTHTSIIQPPPNLRTTDGFTFIALKKICEGEELTADYHTYGADDLLGAQPQTTGWSRCR